MAAIALKTGTAGIRQRNYRVFLAANDYNFKFGQICLSLLTFHEEMSFDHEYAYTMFSEALSLMVEVGECRADSIDVSVEDGESIDGNSLGKIVLGKTGTFAAELINATPDNINKLALLDQKDCIVILVETNGSEQMFDNFDGVKDHFLSVDAHNVIIISNFDELILENFQNVGKNLSVTHRETGGDSIKVMLSIEDSCQVAGSFRKIIDVPYSIEPVLAVSDFTAAKINATTISLSFVGDSSKDGFLVHCAVDASETKLFQGTILSKYIPMADIIGATIAVPGAGKYVLRACAMKNGKIVTSFSDVANVSTT